MARKLRLEYPGAIYHVINRGNYRRNIFETDKTKEAFKQCVFEACERSKWVLHAFAIMINHFHLALETPEGNLVAGMHWLQGTFANRFNRFRKVHGHLFQGRYKAILVEDSKPLGEICDYLHLNPAQAGIVLIERLVEYRHSSYWYLRNPAERPEFLRPQTALDCAGGLPDTPEGWALYDGRLELQAEELARTGGNGWAERSRRLCQGWAIGSDGFKAALVKDYGLAGNIRAWESDGVQEVRELRWSEELAGCFQILERQPEDVFCDRKRAPWKLAIASWMKLHTQAANNWLSAQLNLGSPSALSSNLTLYRRQIQACDPSWKKLTAKKST